MTTISIVVPCLEKTEYMKKNEDILKTDNRVVEFLYEIGTSPIGKARQNLLEKAKGEYLLWVDADVELKNNPISEMLTYINNNIVGVSCSTQELDTTYILHEAIRRTLPEVFPKRRSQFNCALTKKDALLLVGGFNTELSAAEDNDIQIRLNQKGFEILGLRDSVVIHHSNRNYDKEFNYFQGYKYIYNKYGKYEGEADLVDTNSLKFKYNLFILDPKNFISTRFSNLIHKLHFASKLPYQLLRNLIFEFDAELLKPNECGLLVTENCFFKCKSCEFWKTKKEDPSYESLIEIIDKLADFGLPKITLVGGEPLMRPDIDKIIDHIKQRGMSCSIITNGAMIKSKLDSVIKLDHINVSLDGMEATHDFLRGVISWSKNVDYLYELKFKYGKDISVGCVVQDATYKDIAALSNFLKTFQIPLYVMCYNTGGMGQPDAVNPYDSKVEYILENKDLYYLRQEQIEYLDLVLKTFRKQVTKQKCYGPNHKFMIDSKGNIYPCSAWFKPIGNMFDFKTFKELWNSPAYKQLRISMKNGANPHCQTCTSCELTNNFVLGTKYNKKVIQRILNRLPFV